MCSKFNQVKGYIIAGIILVGLGILSFIIGMNMATTRLNVTENAVKTFLAAATVNTPLMTATAAAAINPSKAVGTEPVSATLTPTGQINNNYVIQVSAQDGMAMVNVPAGEFQMGISDEIFLLTVQQCTKEGQKQKDCETRLQDEKPIHKVWLDAFWIDQTDITNEMYQKCVNAGVCQPPSNSESVSQLNYFGNSLFNNYPVIYVNWEQANKYCLWVGRRLPTEAEWEKAARGTDGRTYPWGSTFDSSKTNSTGQDTTPAGSLMQGSSPYGALDMAGNVWQWVDDWYSSSYYGQSPAKNPSGPPSGGCRVVRGGSWNVDDLTARSANRYCLVPQETNDVTGFRCVMGQGH